MNNQVKQNINKITERICKNIAEIRYGLVSTTLKIHNGRIVDITYSTTESKREKGENE